MTKDIEEAASKLLKVIKDMSLSTGEPFNKTPAHKEVRLILQQLIQSPVYQNLRAEVKPSRKEIADFLEVHNQWRRGGKDPMQDPRELSEMIDLAIEELRNDS